MDSARLLDRPDAVPAWVPDIDDEVSVNRLRRVIWIVVSVALLAWVVESSNTPADPVVTDRPIPTEAPADQPAEQPADQPAEQPAPEAGP